MIFIRKKSGDQIPKGYRDWLAENQTEIEALSTDRRSANALWELLGKTLSVRETQIDPNLVRYDLQCSLYVEQGGICCYCGDRLRRDWDNANERWLFPNQSIEHFKGKSVNKELVFSYENLMQSCRNSSGFNKVRVGEKHDGIEVNSWEDVANITGLLPQNIMEYSSNRNLKKKAELEKGDVIHIPNPTHCDDEKSKSDSRPDLVIINPTSDAHLIEKLVFNAEGEIGLSNANEEEAVIIQKTIQVLALSIDKLNQKRKDIWGKTDSKAFEAKYADSFEAINNADISNEERNEVMRRLIEKILEPDDADGLLSAFCFVEYASLKSQFSSIFA